MSFLSSFLKGLLLVSFLPQIAQCVVNTSSLSPLLSAGAKIDTDEPRWSEYKAPHPGAVVHPATEVDVQTTVKWAIAHNVRFLVHNGGNGWATTLNITSDDITINLDQLRSITFNAAKTQVTLGGGALIADVVQAASANNVLVATGSCNCVGYLGAVLGGGLSALQGMYGLGVDELLSLNVVDATGKLTSVTPSNTELWYALRGAGPNFGIVTSAVVRAHPVAQSGLQAWTGSLIFRPDQLEAIVQTTQNLSLRPEMALTLTFINQPATASQIIIASPFYYGSTEAGRAAFKPLLDIGPVADATAVTPYASWNNGSNTACQKGGRRPTWGVGLAHMNPASWSEVYKVWLDLVKQPGAERSSMLLNAYSTTKVRSVPDSSSAVPWRRTINFHASLTAFYTNASFDATALSYGQKARALWRSGDGLCPDAVYINNAFGDESQQTIYGNSLAKLSPLKKKYDPLRRFSQWFPL